MVQGDNILGTRLFQLRIQSNLPKNKVAADLKIARSTLDYIESGEMLPRGKLLLRFADYYNASLDYLFGYVEEPMRLSKKAFEIGLKISIQPNLNQEIIAKSVNSLIEALPK